MNRNKRRGVGISSGPLVTNHIRNLNEELEMLQRRRELLHHEQQLLNNEMYTRKRPYENDQLLHKFELAPQYSATQNFAHLYDDGSGPGYGFGSPQPIKKRHQINVWDDDRYNMNRNVGGPRHGPFAGPNPERMSPPKPLMSITPKLSIGRRIAGPVPQRNLKDFIPNKVTKPKVKPYNTNQPKFDVPALANEKIIHSRNKNQGGQKLLPNQALSPQVAGRLELALGAILKQMKELYPTNEDAMNLFNSKHVQRSIKQSIRERLRSVMLNKVVGRFTEIVEIYRKVYPASADKEVLDNALLNAESLHLVPRFFNKVLGDKLNNMFARLQLLNEGKEAEIASLIESRPSLLEESADETKTRNSNAKCYYTSLIDALLEDRIPKLLPNYTEQIVKLFEESKESKSDDKASKDSKNEDDMTIIDVDAEECVDEKAQITDTDKEKRNDVVELSNINDKIDIETSQIDENINEFVEESVKNVKDIKNEVVSKPVEESAKNVEPVKKEVVSKPVEESIKNVEAVKKQVVSKPVEESVQNVEAVKKEVVSKPVEESVKNVETVKKTVVSKPVEVMDESLADVSIDTQVQQTKSCAASKYFVKVLGQPGLPNRIDAYKFLNKFNAVSIKKHKVIQNLLVVGFNNEKDFNDAIAASGSLVGNSSIIIKANDKLPQNNSSPSPKENKNEKDMIPLDLENQITDLLISIRKSDEDDKEIIKKMEANKDVSVVELNKAEIETKPDSGTILDNTEQSNSLNSTQNSKEDNNPKAKDETEATSDPSKENCRTMEVIKEEDDGKESLDSGNTVVESNDNKSVKTNHGRDTPTKTTRQSAAATPRTIRTRRSSRLLSNN